MNEQNFNWVDLMVLLNERRDKVLTLLAAENEEPDEKLRLDGAARELNWLIEYFQENRADWVATQKK